MYICETCHEVFKSPKVVYPSSGSRAREDCEEVCPICGDTHYTEAEKCPRCGRWHDGTESFCPDCMGEITSSMEYLFDGLDANAKQDMEFEVKQWIEQHW